MPRFILYGAALSPSVKVVGVALSAITFPLIGQHVYDMLTVSDDELPHAMFFIWERLKIIVEPSAALGVAALLEGRVDERGKRVGVIFSGGNANVKSLARNL